MSDNRNTILAVILSGLVLIAWQYFYNVPPMEKQRAAQQARPSSPNPRPRQRTRQIPQTTPQAGGAPTANAPAQPAATTAVVSRDAAIAAGPRVKIDTPTPDRQHLAEGRAHRRSVAGAVPRDRRSRFARDRAVFALGHREPVLRRIRLGRRRRLDGADSRPEHGLAAGGHRQPDAHRRR